MSEDKRSGVVGASVSVGGEGASRPSPFTVPSPSHTPSNNTSPSTVPSHTPSPSTSFSPSPSPFSTPPKGYTSLPKQVVVPGVEGPIRGTLVADYTGMKLSYLAILALEGSLNLKKLTEEQAHMIASEIVLEGMEIINRFPEGGIQRDVRMWAADVCMVHDITARLT